METEIIYISSDESDSQKENKKKSSSSNSTEVSNNALRTKVEVSPNNSEKVEENNLKRKISQISEEKKSLLYHNSEKRKKLNTTQIPLELDKDDSTIPDCTQKSNKEQETTIEVPKLFVKERKKISYVTHDIFPQFISLCLKKCHDNDMEKIVDKLKRRYEELVPNYAGSEKFALFLNEKREAIMNNDKKLYVYIEEVMNEMKRMIKEKLKKKSIDNVTYDAVPSTSYAANKVSINHVAESDNENDGVDHMDSETKRKIKIIEMAMKKCEYRIKKFETAEVDFDEDTDSNYIKMERYKQRMVELYNKYCELTGENADAGRSYLRPKHISTTQIVAVDQAITNFINSKISKRNQWKTPGSFTNNIIFPDYRDILECVKRCNEKRNLGLTKNKQIEMAKKAFVELGELLQRSRRNDYWDTFSLYLENTEEDPAIKDKELANKLTYNRNEGQKKLTAVFEKYVKKQEEIKEQVYNGTTTEDESDMDDDDKDEDEDDIEDEDKNNDILSLYTSSNEDNDSVKDVNKTNQNNTSAEKNNNKTVNVNRDTNGIASSKVEGNLPQEKCEEKKVEVKTTKENHVSTSKDESKIVTDTEKVSRSPISNAVMTSKNVTGIDAKTQANSVPTSTTNCADITNRTEEHVAEVVIEDVHKVVTKSPAEVITKERATVLTNMVHMITEDVTEVITGDVEEVITEVTELVVKDKVNELTDAPKDKLSDEAKKPLLRVRSFAKPPTTWDDGRQKANNTTQENVPKTTSENKDLIDLTDESSVSEPVSATTITSSTVTTRCAIQRDGKVVPLMKHQRLVLPRNNIISVQNITNNYLKVDMRTGEIIAPARNIQAPTIIRVPSTQTAIVQPNQVQNTSVITTTNKASIKRNETILRIIPKKTLVVKTSDPKVTKTQVRVIPATKPK
ncbi:FK506-binding protein 5-like [Odontomachus brunneus]|uniref:FK506-binding protein 5-like n=1 Tax=Odontomachus brunneus TaxID=486640 RepID=UPI0013F182EC|nr:FK506-binding protein 5-like [Odontomachus brunneus]XP_032666500.1 FK506-binding protein 5-like [Odontomachus brunneus]